MSQQRKLNSRQESRVIQYYINKMSNTYTQSIAFNLPLPSFLQSFKNQVLSVVIPRLNIVISDLQKSGDNSSIVSLLCLIFIFLIIQSLVGNLFKKKEHRTKTVTQNQIDEQIRNLSKEISNLKNSLKKIIQSGSSRSGNKEEKGEQDQDQDQQGQRKILGFYREAADDFNNLASYVIDSQELILRELKNMRKSKISDRASVNNSRDESFSQYERSKISQNKSQYQQKNHNHTVIVQKQVDEKIVIQQKASLITEEKGPQIVQEKLQEVTQLKRSQTAQPKASQHPEVTQTKQVKLPGPMGKSKVMIPPPGVKKRAVPPPPIPK